VASEAPVSIHGLTKRYGDVVALDNLCLEVSAGEVLGYLGPNGAGKTTTLRLLLGLAVPTAGSASIFGLDVTRQTIDAHRLLAYVPGEVSLWPSLTGEETLHLLARVHGKVDTEYRDRLVRGFELDTSRRVRAYSKGNRQKLILIAAFMVRPRLLLLDEPSSGLDPLMEQVFRACVLDAKADGQTVFLSSHLLGEVEALCDTVAILRAGRLIESGSLSQMRHLSSTIIEATFEGSPPDVNGIEGVQAVVVAGNHLTCQVHGPIGPLLKILSDSRIVELGSREPSLEELFLAHYGTHDAGADATNTA